MAEMNSGEKLLINSDMYNYLYRKTYVKWFLDFCDIKGETLEVGCGIGHTSDDINKRFDGKLTALDYDPELVESAKKLHGKKDIKFLSGDGRALPFKDQSFDTVISMNTFHHIEGHQKAIKEVFRVLRPGGSFYLMNISRYFLWPLYKLWPCGDHLDAKFTKNDMMADLENAAFKIVKHKGWDVFMLHAKK
jgi:ubiquinone/menaquinone biosynthesis C-methylase UbiE